MSEPDVNQLQGEISALYKRLGTLPIPPGSFPMVDSFLGTGSPTGYALVLDRLAEARKALNSGEAASGERLFFEAQSRFEWCQTNSDWIGQRLLGAGAAGDESGGGSYAWRLLRSLARPLRWTPRWVVGAIYLSLWLVAAALLASLLADDKLVGVPLPFIFWGVTGGVAAGLFGLWLHTARADFDPRYVPWYAAKPLIGGMSGALVFLMAEIIQSSSAVGERELYLAAFVLGFFEATLIKVLVLVSDQTLALMTAAFGKRGNSGASTRK